MAKANKATKATATKTATPAAAVTPPAAAQFVVGQWAVRGNTSIRAYCKMVAQQLQKQHGAFTAAQWANAMVATGKTAAAKNYKQPNGGWATKNNPLGVALNHANYFIAQGYVQPKS